MIMDFKMIIIKMTEENCDSGSYTVKYHLIDHHMDDKRISQTLCYHIGGDTGI